jgi:hypothetical protein
VFSSSPWSADFNPRYFNRARRLLESEGKLCPPGDIPEDSRKLADRFPGLLRWLNSAA